MKTPIIFQTRLLCDGNNTIFVRNLKELLFVMQNNRRALYEGAIHIIAWGLFLGFPLFFVWNRNNGVLDMGSYLRHGTIPLAFCILFYLNYFIFVPKLLFRGKTKEYIGVDIIVIMLFTLILQIVQTTPMPRKAGFVGPDFKIDPMLFILFRDFCSMVLVSGLAAAIKMSRRWQVAENARREAEKSRSEAELKNLRNQLNPHFLLNTLNNIYALIALDSDKAQEAVQELSRLLRYVLYDNQYEKVPLGKEAGFIRDYISLMKIRVSPDVTVETRITIDPESRTEVAPLIFISLIENAFKHGISPSEKSRIKISLSENEKEIRCDIRNSYHPKTETDKSGSGIGLEQVSKRLELLYPGKYVWDKGIENNIYYSIIVIEKH